MQYYLNYVLGLPRSSSKKADQGTIVHKVMEVLANCKRCMQPPPTTEYIIKGGGAKTWGYSDEHIGLVEWDAESFLCPHVLLNEDVDAINKTRINKYKYKEYAKIPYNTIHYGQKMVDDIFNRVYDYYSGEDWMPVDRKDCHNWAWMALEYKDGIFDPRKRNIVDAEPHFDFVIEKEWARYDWVLPNGENISGFLGIKGTIDLITSHEGGILEIVDWKTGQRKDWATKIKSQEEKTYDKLCLDFQLMLYYYAARHLYPDAKQIIVSIMFVRDGGPFTICMDEETINGVERRLCERFQQISACQYPAMQDATQRDFRCTKICDYYREVGTPNGDNICKFIHQQIGKKGIDEVTKKYTQENFSVGHYQEPGEK